jgi:fatty-acyl-CoA synthase
VITTSLAVLDHEHHKADLTSLLHADPGTSGVSPRMAAMQGWDVARKPGSVGLPAFPGALWIDEVRGYS